MNDIASDRVGPMQNPPHLGETHPREHGRCRLERNRDGGASRVRARNTVAPVERQGGHVGKHGAGTGRYRLGQPPLTGCGCRRATNLRRRAATGPQPNGGQVRCTHDRASRALRWTGNCPACNRPFASGQRQAVRCATPSGSQGRYPRLRPACRPLTRTSAPQEDRLRRPAPFVSSST